MAGMLPPNSRRTFADVLRQVGPKPALEAGQHATRHYSETLSKQFAHWIREMFSGDPRFQQVLPPEAPVPTIHGTKSLDVAALDGRGYLLLDISIKTFNYKDAKTKNYRHNYTGRFYELLGEELDIRRSYRLATLVAMIILPVDSCFDTDPSSFAHAVRQFSKVTKAHVKAQVGSTFELVFIGLHNPNGEIYFVDARQDPPRTGEPSLEARITPEQFKELTLAEVDLRKTDISSEELPVTIPFF
jgi:hypothetical protein